MRVPPIPTTADDVLVWLLGDGHLSLVDIEERPIGERASPLYPQCPREERVVAFGDLRDATGLPANIAALRQVSGCLDACLRAMNVPAARQPSDHARLRTRLETMCLLAPLLALRTGEIARVEHAAVFKLCLGFREMQNDALLQDRVDAEQPVDADAMIERLLVDPLLVGDVQVCAGSRKQIRVVLDALLSERVSPLDTLWSPLGEDWFQAAVEATTTLQDLVAIAAAVALGLLDRGVRDAGSACGKLAMLPRGPRISHALRARSVGGPLRVTLLYRPDRVPGAVRALLESLGERLSRPTLPSLEEVDGRLMAHAAPVVATLMTELGRADASPLSLSAFRRFRADP